MKLVVGISGTIGSGKEMVVDFLKKKYSNYHVSLSSMIRSELERKRKDFNRMTLQDHGNEMRSKYGSGILAMLGIEYLPRDKEMILVEGIRNPGEIEYLKRKFGKQFVMVGIDATPEMRFERLMKRAKPLDPKTWEEFVLLDNRDQGEGEPPHGQQLKACLEKCDLKIFYDGTNESIEQKLVNAFQEI